MLRPAALAAPAQPEGQARQAEEVELPVVPVIMYLPERHGTMMELPALAVKV